MERHKLESTRGVTNARGTMSSCCHCSDYSLGTRAFKQCCWQDGWDQSCCPSDKNGNTLNGCFSQKGRYVLKAEICNAGWRPCLQKKFPFSLLTKKATRLKIKEEEWNDAGGKQQNEFSMKERPVRKQIFRNLQSRCSKPIHRIPRSRLSCPPARSYRYNRRYGEVLQ